MVTLLRQWSITSRTCGFQETSGVKMVSFAMGAAGRFPCIEPRAERISTFARPKKGKIGSRQLAHPLLRSCMALSKRVSK